LTALLAEQNSTGFKERLLFTPIKIFSKLKISGLYAAAGLLIGCRR